MTIKTLPKGCFFRFIFLLVLGGVGFSECSLSASMESGWGSDIVFLRPTTELYKPPNLHRSTPMTPSTHPSLILRLRLSTHREEEDTPPPLPPTNPFLPDLLTWDWADIAPILMAIYNGERLADLDWVNKVEARLQKGRINDVPLAVIQRFTEWPVLAIAFRGEDGRSLIEALSAVGYNPEMANNLEIMLGGAIPRYAETIALLLRMEDQRERFQEVYTPSSRFVFFNRAPLFPFIWTGNVKLVLALLWSIKDAGPYAIWQLLNTSEPFLRDGARWKPVKVLELLAALNEQALDDLDRPTEANYDEIEKYIRRLQVRYYPARQLR